MDVNYFKQNAKNLNTTKSTNVWFNNYLSWALKNGNVHDIHKLEKTELNGVLENYFADAMRRDGKQYEPSSLCAMQAGIDRHLKEMGCHFSILKDVEFKGSRDVLEGKAKYLRQVVGMGNTPNAAKSLTLQEENILWQSGQLGTHSARSLTNTVWFLLTQHLGLRGRQEHHSMRVEDFESKLDDDGNKFITFKEGCTKTRGGGLRKKKRASIPKMFETCDENRCPLMIFELFLSKRPPSLRESGPLYLGIIDNPKCDIWFKISRLGVNSLDTIMKSMVEASPLITKKKLTNHSARKTVIKKLRKSGASRSEIIEITGHSNDRGLDPYDSGDEVQQRRMSHAIDQPSTSRDASLSSSLIMQGSMPDVPVKSFSKGMLKRNFSLLSEEEYFKLGERNTERNITYNFSKCNVSFGGNGNENKTEAKRKLRRIICSSDSSQD